MATGGWFPSSSWGPWGDAGTGLKVSCVACAVVGTELGSRPCEIRGRPKRRSCLQAMNIQREMTIQKLPSYWSESTSQLPGVELGCTSLDFVVNPRRFVSSSNHDWRQIGFAFTPAFTGSGHTKKPVSLSHHPDSIFQSAPKGMKIIFTNLNPKVIWHTSKSKMILSMPWLTFTRIPENAPDLELPGLPWTIQC